MADTPRETDPAIEGLVADSRRPEVSVVIPVKEGERFLPHLFAALDQQTLPRERFEVILVDDNSRDQSKAIAAAWVSEDPSRRRLVYGNGGGPAYARNLGLHQAHGRVIASTDCDTVPDPDWLEAALNAIDRTGAKAIEGAIDAWPPEEQAPHKIQWQNLHGSLYMTGNMFYDRSLLESLGGYDERFAYHLEDSDLGCRIVEAGYEIPFVPEARVRHWVRDRSFVDVMRSAKRIRWVALFAARHPDRYETQIRGAVRPLTAIEIDVLIALFSAAAIPRSRGLARSALLLVAANGLRRAFGSSSVLSSGSKQEFGKRVGLSLLFPGAKAFWWVEGCVRFRKFTR